MASTTNISTPQPTASAQKKHIVTPLLPSEVPQWQHIRHETFRTTVNRIIYTREPSQETQDKVVANITKDITDPGTGWLYMACRDHNSGEMIAGARWRYVGPKKQILQEKEDGVDAFNLPFVVEGKPVERSWEEVEAGFATPEPYAESNPAVFKGLFDLFSVNKREILGARPYYYLQTLVTHPDHHRKGAGGLMLKCGCDEADKRNVECYLEASPMGVPLYARYGFEKIKVITLDMSKFENGGEEKHDFIIMRRPARWEREQRAQNEKSS